MRLNRKTRYYLASVGSSALVGFAIAGLFLAGYFVSLQSVFSDKLYSERTHSSEITIVAIDNESIGKIGRWPWDRSVHAEFFKKLAAFHPRAVGVDIAFLEPTAEDTLLAQSLFSLEGAVIALEADVRTGTSGNLIAETIRPPAESLRAVNAGLANTPVDEDGILRAVPLEIRSDTKKYPALFTAILQQYYGNEDFLTSIPKRADGSMLINFAGGPGSFAVIPYSRVLTGEARAEDFAGKIVLVGATASDLHDEQLVPTSRGELMPGVEIHANAIDTVLSRSFLREQARGQTVLLILALSLLCGFLFTKLRIFQAIVSALLLGIGYIIAVIAAFDRGLIMNIFYPLSAIALCFLSVIVVKYIFEGRERRKVRGALSQYISKEVVEEVLKQGELKLGGSKKNITVMFSDIRGFTSISEALGPEKLVELLNGYLTAVTEVILKRRGVVDKYIGDAVMAFWGAPLEEKNHAYLACVSALEMSAAAETFSGAQGEGTPPIKTGYGINTGDVIVGNMGSHQRFDYTAIGDAVNLASRLEGLNKEYGTEIIASSMTIEAIQKSGKLGEFAYRFLDRVIVKGKNEPVPIYEILNFKENFSGSEWLAVYEKGVEAFEKQDAVVSRQCFERVIEIKGDDGPSRFFLKRLEDIEKGDASWEAATKMTHK